MELRAALVPLRGCQGILGLDSDLVMHRIQDGRLLWAWDLRRRNARRPFLAVLAESLRVLQKRERKAFQAALERQHDTAEWTWVLGRILPHPKPVLRSSEVARALGISSTHALNLVRDGLLTALPARRLRTASPFITRASVEHFLRERRVA